MSRGDPQGRCSVVVGGSSGVGRALVTELARRGDTVLAAARDRRDLEALQNDCSLRFGARVETVEADLAAADFDARDFAKQCIARLGRLSHLFIPLGAVDARDRGLPPDPVVSALAAVNYVRPAQVLTAFCEYFASLGNGTAMVFTSIAAHAPRGHNGAYAAAKCGLEFYCRALQHHFAGSGVSIQICALGYVDTSMTFGMRLLFPATDPARVARFALRMSARRRRFAYFPRYWSLILMTLKALPWPVYKRLRF